MYDSGRVEDDCKFHPLYLHHFRFADDFRLPLLDSQDNQIIGWFDGGLHSCSDLAADGRSQSPGETSAVNLSSFIIHHSQATEGGSRNSSFNDVHCVFDGMPLRISYAGGYLLMSPFLPSLQR